MQTLEERNTSTQIDAPQVHRICDLVLNKDLSQHLSVKAGRYCNQETDRDLSVRDLKTSSNSPKWTNSEMKGQNSRVSVKSKSKLSKKSILTWIPPVKIHLVLKSLKIISILQKMEVKR